jgi:hypothetical protein
LSLPFRLLLAVYHCLCFRLVVALAVVFVGASAVVLSLLLLSSFVVAFGIGPGFSPDISSQK